jgi:hypothetical protein
METRCGNSGTQALINSLVWGNGYSQVVDIPTRGDAFLDVYLVQPESSFTSSSIVQGISDHSGVILEEVGRKWLGISGIKGSPGVQQNRCFRLTNLPPR